MRNSHLVLIMSFLIVIIIAGAGSIYLIVRPNLSPVVTSLENTSVLHPNTSVVPVPSTSSTSSPTYASNPLIGKWDFIQVAIEEDGQRLGTGNAAVNDYPVLEFFEDGTYVASGKYSKLTIRGKYVIEDENHYSVEVVEADLESLLSEGNVTVEFNVVGDKLITTFQPSGEAYYLIKTYIRR